MNVKWIFGGRDPYNKEVFLGCVTTDAPEEFKLWLAMYCPSHTIAIEYYRNDTAMSLEGGYRWRINAKISEPKDQIMFKLSWHGQK